MNSEIKVSVVMPVYNVQHYLVRCLDSLIAQTLQNVEFGCVVEGLDPVSHVCIRAAGASCPMNRRHISGRIESI